MQQNNVFTIAKRNVEGQDMLYQSLKLTNNVWVLAEIKIPPGGSTYTVITVIKDRLNLITFDLSSAIQYPFCKCISII
jgi:hypothetical protein